MADVLYGVTMEERGVSKIVSVKFRKADETAPEQSPVSEPSAAAVIVAGGGDSPLKREEVLEMALPGTN